MSRLFQLAKTSRSNDTNINNRSACNLSLSMICYNHQLTGLPQWPTTGPQQGPSPSVRVQLAFGLLASRQADRTKPWIPCYWLIRASSTLTQQHKNLKSRMTKLKDFHIYEKTLRYHSLLSKKTTMPSSEFCAGTDPQLSEIVDGQIQACLALPRPRYKIYVHTRVNKIDQFGLKYFHSHLAPWGSPHRGDPARTGTTFRAFIGYVIGPTSSTPFRSGIRLSLTSDNETILSLLGLFTRLARSRPPF
ncbi:hypothetical protein QBC43DRAFT_120066 [Cladorrhinum sp. PSN259]|nr:hypothetical protein QBC43DRAFT_120066 [Cladorrhinum sp. PSN259]